MAMFFTDQHVASREVFQGSWLFVVGPIFPKRAHCTFQNLSYDFHDSLGTRVTPLTTDIPSWLVFATLGRPSPFKTTPLAVYYMQMYLDPPNARNIVIGDFGI